MAVKLADTLAPMGEFPIANAKDIDFDDGESLQEKLDNGTLGGGGSDVYALLPTTQIDDQIGRIWLENL